MPSNKRHDTANGRKIGGEESPFDQISVSHYAKGALKVTLTVPVVCVESAMDSVLFPTSNTIRAGEPEWVILPITFAPRSSVATHSPDEFLEIVTTRGLAIVPV